MLFPPPRMLPSLAFLTAFAYRPALATPRPIELATALPPIMTNTLAVNLQPFATLPKVNGTGTRIQYLIGDPTGTGGFFAVDEAGIIDRISADGKAVSTYLNISTAVSGFSANNGEKGLVGLAFHPNFASDPNKPGYGVFYTAYSRDSTTATFLQSATNNHTQVIAEWTTPNPLDASFAGSNREVLSIGHFANNHNGGVIGFNPAAKIGSADYGNLYIGLGDGGSGNDPNNNGQNITSPLGKILRINPIASGTQSYTIPTDNPFVTNTDGIGAAPLVYAYGLRNPQQFSFDKSGRMFIDDIGQVSVEEVNIGQKGANYGWQQREGRFATGSAVGVGKDGLIYELPNLDVANGYTYPIAEYSHAAFGPGGYAIGSGFLYSGKLLPQLDGMYVFSDFAQNRLFYIDPSQNGPSEDAPIHELAMNFAGTNYLTLNNSPLAVNGRPDLRVGQGLDGELFALIKGVGDIMQIEPRADVTPVSEPSTLALLAVGLIGFRIVRRRC